jgi:heme oxygenase
MSAPNLMTRLREATREVHDQLETLPYFQALDRGELPMESYVGQLRAMAVLHGVLEHEIPNARDDRLNAVWMDNLRRFPQIQADLGFFASRTMLDIAAAHEAAGVLANHILRRSVEQPVSLLGYLYVLEGSIGGAKVLAPRFSQAFGLDIHRGLAYLTWDHTVAGKRWRDFGERMNATPVNATESEAIIDAAQEAFAGIRQVFTALYPFDAAQLTRKATSLNPEAGAHPAPEDPGELDAAHRAGARCWREYPYFAWRYGERGWRYTQSDGAWLITLKEHDQPVIDAQVAWLSGVLSSRGMPSLLLQRHLELLYEELVGRMPERGGVGYGKLLAAADHLAEQRRSVVADADLDWICSRFEQAVGPDWRGRLPGTGALLVCAVADRARGIEQAVVSLESWLADPQRFPAHWITALHEALHEAEARLRAR